MTNRWIVHSKVDTWRTGKNSTEFFIDHKIWFTNAPSAEVKVKLIKPGHHIAYHDNGKIWAVGVVEAIGDFQPHPLIFLTDVTVFDPPKPSPIKFPEVQGTLHGPYSETDEKAKAVWG